MEKKIERTEKEWRGFLTPEQYHILREKGTERAFSGNHNAHSGKGMYICAGCGNELFSSDAKYDSGSGWPSYRKPISAENIETKIDRSHGMIRTEVKCSRCGGHLGHVFDDGPLPSGLRYCINSGALEFMSKDDKRR